ncbi:MAG: peptidoglycan DD-metalloendopeptidase family protein [Candidatus Woesearchaeota archaeon]
MVDRSLIERIEKTRSDLYQLEEERKRAEANGDTSEILRLNDAIFGAKSILGALKYELSQTATSNPQAPPNPQPVQYNAGRMAVRDPRDEEARRRLWEAAQRAGHTARATGRAALGVGRAGIAGVRAVQAHSGNIAFLIIAFSVIFFEFSSAYFGNWQTRVGFYTILVFGTLLFRDVALTKRAAVAAIVMNVAWYAYLSAAGTPAFSDMLNSQAGKAVASVLILPAFAWYFLYLEPNVQISKLWRNIGWLPIVGLMIALGVPILSHAAGLVPMPATGFDPGPAARDTGMFILGGVGEALRDFVCFLGVGGGACGVADSWLAQLTEPFAHDATTVHEIQHRNLGVYIRDARVDGPIDVAGYGAGSFLPRSIDFYVHAPIPEDIEIDLCSVRAEELKAFPGICDNTIRIRCDVEDVGTTQIIPRSQMSIRGAVASLGSLFSCRMQPPDDAALQRSGGTVSKRAHVSVEYPFVTTTFKLIRAVSINEATSREALSELRNFRESRVISSGGPVIVEVSDSEFITVDNRDDGQGYAQESLVIRLKAEPEVRIEGLDQMIVFVPNGSRIESTGPGSYCDFVKGDAIFEEHRSICERTPQCPDGERSCAGICIPDDLDTTDQDCEEFGREGGTRSDVNTCAYDLGSLLGGDMVDRPSNVYLLSANAINRINSDLASGALDQDSRWIAARSRTNGVDIGCRLIVDDHTEFLQQERLVTERALNIITSYRVSHAQDVNVRFTGRPEPTPSMLSSAALCSITNLNADIPTGIMPLEGSPLRITDPYGTTPRSNDVGYHVGVDLAGPRPGDKLPVRAAWGGVIEYVESGCREGDRDCGNRYGNYVTIRTNTPDGTFIHRYAHLESDSTLRGLRREQVVHAGQRIGTMGNTGLSDGVHLHFEVRVQGIPLNPLLFMPRNEVRALGGFGTRFSESQVFKSHHETRCVPIVHDYSSDDLSNMANAVSRIASEFGEFATEEKVRKVIDAAVEQGIPPDILLGVVMQENRFNHRIGIGNRGVHTTRDGETISLSVDGESVGMMQIQSVGRQTLCDKRWNEFQNQNPGVSYADAHANLDFHIRCGAEILKHKYGEAQRLLRDHGAYCGVVCECAPSDRNRVREAYDQRDIFPPETDPWTAGVKGYNGWGCQPTAAEAFAYVNNVLGYAQRARSAAEVAIERENEAPTRTRTEIPMDVVE